MSLKYFKTPFGIQTVEITLTGAINANSSVGTAGQVLTSNGSIAYWATPVAGSGDVNLVQSNLSALTSSVNTIKANVDSVQSNVAAILSGSSTLNNPVITGSLSANGSIGTTGQVLTSNGSIAYWATPTTGSTSASGFEQTFLLMGA